MNNMLRNVLSLSLSLSLSLLFLFLSCSCSYIVLVLILFLLLFFFLFLFLLLFFFLFSFSFFFDFFFLFCQSIEHRVYISVCDTHVLEWMSTGGMDLSPLFCCSLINVHFVTVLVWSSMVNSARRSSPRETKNEAVFTSWKVGGPGRQFEGLHTGQFISISLHRSKLCLRDL